MADTRLGGAVGLDGRAGSLLAVMLLDPVALQLRALLGFVVPLRFGARGGCRGFAHCGVRALPSGASYGSGITQASRPVCFLISSAMTRVLQVIASALEQASR